MDLRRASAALVFLATAATFTATAVAQTAGAAGAGSAPSSTPAGAFVPGQVLAHFRSGMSAAARAAVVRGVGATNGGTIRDLDVSVLRVPDGAEQRVIDALLRSGKVSSAERNGVVSATDVVPNDPYWANEWGPKKIGTSTAWSHSTGAGSVTVAILDSGLNTSLAEFSGRVLPGYNFIGGNTNVTDDNGHGTQVAGVAVAQGNNATSVAGMCWSCAVLPVKVLDANAQGSDSAVASGITWAADHGARVINLSLGSTTASSTEASAVSYAQSKGALVVAAAGNNGTSDPFYPANIAGVLSVAASDQFDKLFSYSERGSWVDVAAPGSNYTVAPSGNTFTFGGTSSASPVVAGLAGLLASAVPSATASDLTNAVTGTTDPLSGGGIAAGRVNASNAMAALTGIASPSPSPSPTTSVTSSTAPTSSSPSPSPAPAQTSAAFTGSIAGKGAKTFPLTTSGGQVIATVSGTTASVTVAILGSNGSVVASATGGSGTAVAATLPAGSFSVSLSSTAKTKFQLSVSYYA
jgi:thermitase